MTFERSVLARAALCALCGALPAAHAQQASGTLAPVVVTADPFAAKESDAIIAPARVLSGDELRDKLGGSLGDTLSKEPGVNASAFSAGASRPVIRGLEGPRVKILQNGMGSGDLSAISNDHAVGTSLLSAQQIEILRGPATLLYGSGAIGGAINIVNGRIPTQLERYATGEAELRAGSVDSSHALAFSADRSAGDIGLHIDGSSLRAGDYRIPVDSGRLSFSGNRDDNLGVGASLIQSWGYVGASLSQTDKLYGIHGRDENSRIDLAQTRVDLDSLIRSPMPGFDALRIKLGHNNYQHTELEDGTDPNVKFSNRLLESRWELSHLPIGGWRGKLGLQTDNSKVQALNVADPTLYPTVPRTRSSSAAAFMVEETDIDNVRINAGARIEQVARRPDSNTARDFTLASASAGAMWTFTPGYALGLTASFAQRAPTAEELYSNGMHHPTETFDKGDATLRKESSQNLDLSLQKTADRLRWRANLFQNKVSNFVYGSIGDEVCATTGDDPNGSACDTVKERSFRQADATLRGYEIDLSYNLHEHGWYGRVFADASRGTLDQLGNLPLQPASRIGVTAGYQDDRWRSSLSLLDVSAHHRIANSSISDETATRGYLRLDASLSYLQRAGTTDLTWFLLARNLLNEEIRLSTSLLKDYVPQPGRNLIIGVRARF